MRCSVHFYGCTRRLADIVEQAMMAKFAIVDATALSKLAIGREMFGSKAFQAETFLDAHSDSIGGCHSFERGTSRWSSLQQKQIALGFPSVSV